MRVMVLQAPRALVLQRRPDPERASEPLTHLRNGSLVGASVLRP
jgi:hypothetical protein